MAKAQFLSDKILCFIFFQVLYDDLQAQIDQENEGQEEQEVAEDHEQEQEAQEEQDNKYKEFQQELESKITFVNTFYRF